MDMVMLDACMRNRNAISVAMARRNAEAAGSRLPRASCGEQVIRLMRTADPALPSELFLTDVQRIAERMEVAYCFGDPMEISLDGHEMPKDDRKRSPKLINAKSKKRKVCLSPSWMLQPCGASNSMISKNFV